MPTTSTKPRQAASTTRKTVQSSRMAGKSAPKATATESRARRQTPATTSTDKLTKQLDGLSLNKGKSKASGKTQEEIRVETMCKVNAASQTLSRCLAAKERHTGSSKRGSDSQEARLAGKDALSGLHYLRTQRDEPSLDVERAAVSILSKLVSLELHDLALDACKTIHPSLCSLHRVEASHDATSLPMLLSVPVPSNPDASSQILDNLTITYLLQALTVHVAADPATIPSICTYVQENQDICLCAWVRFILAKPSHDTVTVRQVLTRAYTVLIRPTSSSPTPPNSKEKSSNSVDPRTALLLRFQALRTLLLVPPDSSENDKELRDKIWDQAVRFASAYVSAISKATSVGDKQVSTKMAMKLVSDNFLSLSLNVEGIGKNWTKFLDCWSDVARKAGDLISQSRIASFASPDATTPSNDGTQQSSSSLTSSLRNEAESKQFCAMLSQAETVLTSEGSFDTDAISALVTELTGIASSPDHVLLLPESEDMAEWQRRPRRYFERLRRAALRSLDSSSAGLVPLVKSIVSVLQARLSQHTTNSAISSLLDCYFALARTSLIVRNVTSWTTTFQWVSLAAATLGISLEGFTATAVTPGIDIAPFTLALYATLHNLASSLYNADEYAGAIKFLNAGCTVGTVAVAQFAGGKAEESSGYQQLESQLWKRWELLGVCFMKIGDRREAFAAFHRSLQSLASNSATENSEKLTTLVERLTLMGCDLRYTHERLSLSAVGISPLIACRLSRIQLQCLLHPSRRHKSTTHNLVPALLTTALSACESKTLSLHRAGLLLIQIEWWYYSASLPSVTSVEDEIISLLGASSTDTSLSDHDTEAFGSIAEMKILTSLWSILMVHRNIEASLDTRVEKIHVHAAAALQALDTALDSSAKPASSSKKASPSRSKPAAPSRTTRNARTAPSAPPAPKKNRVIKARSAKGPKSPPRQALRDLSLNSPGGPKLLLTEVKRPIDFVGMIWGDADKLYSLLQQACAIFKVYGLISLRMQALSSLRRFCLQTWGKETESYTQVSLDLAEDYIQLGAFGQADSIFVELSGFLSATLITESVIASVWLSYAESKVAQGDLEDSVRLYNEAVSAASRLPAETRLMPTTEKIILRNKRLELAARASKTFAWIQILRSDGTAALNALLQSLRVWNRIVSNLARLAPNKDEGHADDSDPFGMDDLKDALPETTSTAADSSPSRKATASLRAIMDGCQWKATSGLLECMSALSHIYLQRGSPREALYFLDQAFALAESIGAPGPACSALIGKAEILLVQGNLQECTDIISQALDYVPGIVREGEEETNAAQGQHGVHLAELKRICGDFSARTLDDNAARESYQEALQILDGISSDMNTWRIDRSKSASSVTDNFFLTPLASVLRQQVWLLRDEENDESHSLLNRFLDLPLSTLDRAEANALLARLTLHNVYSLCRSDLVLSSIAESTISLPMGMTTQAATVSPTIREITSTLDNSERLFLQSLTTLVNVGKTLSVRESALALAQITALKTSLGASEEDGPALTAGLLDCSIAVTLRRELLESIPQKLGRLPLDDLQWPLLDASGALSIGKIKPTSPISLDNSFDLEATDGEEDMPSLRTYWDSIQKKYSSPSITSDSVNFASTESLPQNWTVIHIGVTEDKNTLFISRRRGGETDSPLVFSVPLKGRRENDDEEELLTFEAALEQFKDIIQQSDKSAKAAADVPKDDKDARMVWWRTRAELDTKLKELLANIEFCWLGAFKTILSPKPRLSAETLSDLRMQFDRIFHLNLRWKDKKPKPPSTKHRRTGSQSQSLTHVKLDDALIECFSTLSPECQDEELEDLVYFILDLYQYHGVPIAVSEVDITQVVVDLRTLLQDHSEKTSQSRKGRPRGRRSTTSVDPNEHTFLILDHNVQPLPWESIPMLRGRSVSRVPSLDFLLDRVELAEHTSNARIHDRMPIDPKNGFCFLNPSGDLTATQGRFQSWAQEMKTVGWGCIIGSAPTEQQFAAALRERDLVVYFGHGSGEQYIRSHKIRSLPKCAAVMLWGCSSGLMKDMGDFDRIGTPNHYMVAGCPSLVANLWDVTDRDIDKVSQAVMDKLQLNVSGIKASTSRSEVSLPTAVAQSRDACKLKYLTGASTVVYGIPWYL